MTTSNGLRLWREPFNPVTEFFLMPASRTLQTESSFLPACDLEEQKDHYLLAIEMPGVKKEDIKMEVVDNQIVVSGERKSESSGKAGEYTYSERRFGKFHRTFTLPVAIDSNQVEASYSDGILRVLAPKAESAKPRQIKITNESTGSKFFSKILGHEKEEQVQTSTEKLASN